jgi:hypothetical protein
MRHIAISAFYGGGRKNKASSNRKHDENIRTRQSKKSNAKKDLWFPTYPDAGQLKTEIPSPPKPIIELNYRK